MKRYIIDAINVTGDLQVVRGTQNRTRRWAYIWRTISPGRSNFSYYSIKKLWYC